MLWIVVPLLFVFNEQCILAQSWNGYQTVIGSEVFGAKGDTNTKRFYKNRTLKQDEVISLSMIGCDPAQENCDTGMMSISTSDDLCVDITPPGATFTCDSYKELRQCDNIGEDYCQRTCGKCCEDQLIPGTQDCNQVVEDGICDTSLVKGNYCQKTCGFCALEPSSQSQGTSSVPPTLEDEGGVSRQNSLSADPELKNAVQNLSSSSPSSSVLEDLLSTDSVQSPPVPVSFVSPPSPSPPEQLSVYAPQGLDCSSPEALACDVNALLSFKNELTRGQELFKSWVGEDPSEWEYVTMEKVAPVTYRVNALDLEYSLEDDSISGSLVPEFSDLRFITSFAIQRQDIAGTFPTEYSLLDQLKYFKVGSTKVSGTFPPSYSTWSNIELIETSDNNIEGTLPLEWSVWTLLHTFSIWENPLISGTLPPHFSTWTNVQQIDVINNNIQGAIPAEWSMWEMLRNFIVWNNKLLTGSLPPEFSVWKQLSSFSIFNNIVSGTIPVEYSVWKSLEYFQVQDNQLLTGPLPSQFSEWTSLTWFSIDRNDLSGTLPAEWSTWTSLEEFSVFSSPFLTGLLPPQYSTFVVVKSFNVNNCKFTGMLPREYSTMNALASFDGSGNNFDGELPVEWSVLGDIVNI